MIMADFHVVVRVSQQVRCGGFRLGPLSASQDDRGHRDNPSLRRVSTRRFRAMTSSDPIALTDDYQRRLKAIVVCPKIL